MFSVILKNFVLFTIALSLTVIATLMFLEKYPDIQQNISSNMITAITAITGILITQLFAFSIMRLTNYYQSREAHRNRTVLMKQEVYLDACSQISKTLGFLGNSVGTPSILLSQPNPVTDLSMSLAKVQLVSVPELADAAHNLGLKIATFSSDIVLTHSSAIEGSRSLEVSLEKMKAFLTEIKPLINSVLDLLRNDLGIEGDLMGSYKNRYLSRQNAIVSIIDKAKNTVQT